MSNRKNLALQMRNLKRQEVAKEVAVKDLFKPPLNRNLIKDFNEPKFFDTSASVSPFSGYVPLNVSLIPQGVTTSTRVGDAVSVKGIELHVSSRTNTAITLGIPLRVLLFQWNIDTAIGTPASTDLLAPAAPGTVFATVAPYNFAGMRLEKIAVLIDHLTYLPTSANGGFTKKWTLPLSSSIRYGTSVTTGVGNYYVAFFTDAAVGAPATVLLDYYARVIFDDD